MVEALAVWCCSTCGAVYHQDFARCPADGGEVVLAPEDPLLGQHVGHYIIDKLVGEGGMGRVYAARHVHLPDKRYAIKVLLGDYAASPSMRKRFTNEAESASRLDHPNLVNVIDFGSMATGLPYIVMEFVSGSSLTDLIEKGPMDPARVIRIARGICAGLAYAHDADVVHRDLKPDNILVVTTAGGDEIPRIADFGLAVSTDPKDARLTSTGMAIGTRAYCAPEQLAGKRVDRRADLYSLGTTMFEMITGGKLPFDGTPMEIMSAKGSRDPRSVGQVAPELAIPIDLQLLIDKLVRTKVSQRAESARAVIAELDDIVLQLAVDERAATVADVDRSAEVPIVRTQVVGRKPTLLAWVIATGALAAIAVAIAAGLWWKRSHRIAPELAVAAPPPPTPAPASAPPPPVVEELSLVPPEEPELEMDPAVRSAPVRQPAHQRTHHPPREARVATVPVPAAKPVEPAPVQPVPSQLEAHFAGIDVSGSLSRAIVQRAIDRVLPAVRQCAGTGAPLTAHVRFTIDESRRPQNVQVSGAGGSTRGCLAGAFAGVRSEAAPDVGDAVVAVDVAFQVKP